VLPRIVRRAGRLVFRHIPLWTWRVCWYGAALATFLVGALILGLRYAVLPGIESYRGDIETALTRAVGQRIAIGSIEADWYGLRPHLVFGDVQVFDAAGRPALVLGRVDHVLSWTSLLHRELRFHSVEIHKPDLAVRRGADGSLFVAGIDVSRGESGGGGLSDWVLRQRDISIHGAAIRWTDELNGAPELSLEEVTLRLRNDGARHRFGLKAVPPAALAGPLDVRGDLTGASISDWMRWEGAIYVQVDYVDIAAWRRWVPLPVEFPSGTGALRMWVDVADERLKHLIADVHLADVRTRLAPELEELELATLSGRIAWQSWKQGFEVSARRLALVTSGGFTLQPADVTLRRHYATERRPARGELKANALDLEPLVVLGEHLPFDAGVRELLERYSPRGSVYDLAAKWTGDWPPQDYDLKARFTNLALDAHGAVPGFRNVSGVVEANEKRGALTLANREVAVQLPRVFVDPIVLDDLAVSASWTVAGGEFDVRLASVTFANEGLAGQLNGAYQSAPEGPGTIDLTGSLTRADARHVARYLPLRVNDTTREWLTRALVAGQSNDVRLRLKGDLADFPFADGTKGVFQVTARANGVTLDYATGWPKIENVTAEVAFTGSRVEIRAGQGGIFGARLARVRALIPDIKYTDELLEVTGEAEGPTADFLRFVAESPVSGMIDHLTQGMEAQGRGRLVLKLDIPLRARRDSRVAGSFQLLGNTVRVDPDLLPLEQANGTIEFTESSVRMTGVSAQMYGGPATISLANQGDGALRITATGRANLDAVRKTASVPLFQHLSGSTEWRGSLTLRNRIAETVIESTLQGVASTLPAPFAKAPDAVVPLRFERRGIEAGQDRILLAWGSAVNAQFMRRRDGARMVVDRGAIGFGTEAPAADRPGLWVAGTLATLDLDHWRAFAPARSAGGEGAAPELPALSGVDVKVEALDVFGRRFNGVILKGREQSGVWQATLSGREVAGEVGWRSQGRGQITARLKTLILPQSQPRLAPEPAKGTEQPADYPGLDLTVEDFQYKDRRLGKLDLVAVPDGRDWRIDRLRVENPDGTFTADGSWQWRTREPRTLMNVHLEAADIGKLLTRLGYPEGVKRGTARLDGTLAWAGPPQDIDLPSLSGNLMVEAGKGQLVKLEPGIGKLLSILSLQALPRRMTLDFKDVFSEGFTFDEVLGAVKIQRGVASAESFRINGSSAKITMSGDIDLAHEMQKLKVRVAPTVGDSVSTVTALLGGPAVGIGIFLAQKLLNDPLGQLIAYEYLITGTWADPHVAKTSDSRGASSETRP